MSSGNRVGIGITDPQYTLDVAGDLNVTGDLLKNGALINFDSGGNGAEDVWDRSLSYSNWKDYQAASNSLWESVTWSPELGLFVAVAVDGSTTNRVMTSTNGIDWIGRDAVNSNSWSSVTWSPELGLFVAVAVFGSGFRVMTSTDGIDWIGRDAVNSNRWGSVIWSPELGLFVAVASPSNPESTAPVEQVMISTDGINWTGYAAVNNNQWRSVTWSSELGLFVAVSNGGIGNLVMTSPNGINWTGRNASTTTQWRSVTWSSELGLFVAVGLNSSIMTSPNGIEWTGRNLASSRSLESVIWIAELGLFVAVARIFEDNVIVSSNGINWTEVETLPNLSFSSVTWSPELGLIVAVGSNSEKVGVSRSIENLVIDENNVVSIDTLRITSSTIEKNLSINGNLRVKENLRLGTATMSQPFGSAPLYSARAWVNFDGNNEFIRSSGNISSVIKLMQGLYMVNFEQPLESSDYTIVGTSGNSFGVTVPGIVNSQYELSQINFQVAVIDSNNNFIDEEYINIIVFE